MIYVYVFSLWHICGNIENTKMENVVNILIYIYITLHQINSSILKRDTNFSGK